MGEGYNIVSIFMNFDRLKVFLQYFTFYQYFHIVEIPTLVPTISQIKTGGDSVNTMAENKEATFRCSGDVGEFGSVRLDVFNKNTNVYEHISTNNQPIVTTKSCMKHWSIDTKLTLSMVHNGTTARCVTAYDDMDRNKDVILESNTFSILVIPGKINNMILQITIHLAIYHICIYIPCKFLQTVFANRRT